MSTSGVTQPVRLLRKHGLWIAFAAIACIVGAAVIGTGGPARYASTAQVDVEGRVLTGTVPVTPNLTTEKTVVTSGRVLAGAAHEFGLTTAMLAKDVTVAVPASTNILSITCTMTIPAAAQRCATDLALAYGSFRNETGSSLAAQAQDPLLVTLVTAASPPVRSGQNLSVLLSLGAIAGLVLGCGGAIARDRLDDRVRDSSDLQRNLGSPVLATIPRAPRWAGPASLILGAPASAAAEAYRRLRVHLEPQLNRAGDQATVVLVTGAQASEGRTSVASNLGAALAQSGLSVLLVDADRRHQSLSRVFRASGEPGVAEALALETPLAELTIAVSDTTLSLLPAGTATDPAAGLPGGPSLARLFAELRDAADVVVVDTGPVLSSADPVALVRVTDIVLFVANVRRTRRAAVRAAVAEVRAAGVAVTAGVVTDIPGAWWATRARRTGGPAEPGPLPGEEFPVTIAGLPLTELPLTGFSPADFSPADTDPAGTDLADAGLADAGLAGTGLADTGPADTGPAETGPAGAELAGQPEPGPLFPEALSAATLEEEGAQEEGSQEEQDPGHGEDAAAAAGAPEAAGDTNGHDPGAEVHWTWVDTTSQWAPVAAPKPGEGVSHSPSESR